MAADPIPQPKLKAPFPYFGGKSRVAAEVWRRFGNVPNYLEPFCGTAAAFLGRPDEHAWWERIETLNDADGFITNLLRALKADPESVAEWCNDPVVENDLHARHLWLLPQRADLVARLEGNPDFYDARIAGWWVWGASMWIAGGWCAGNGPWQSIDGLAVKVDRDDREGEGVKRERPHLQGRGQGVHRKGINTISHGHGVHAAPGVPNLDPSKVPDLSAEYLAALGDWFCALQNRLRGVRVCCGDFERILGATPTFHCATPCGVFLDPPYGAGTGRDMECYGAMDDGEVAVRARTWALAHGDDDRFRIAICGYRGEHDTEMVEAGWTDFCWKALGAGATANESPGKANRFREVIWFSPHCLPAEQTDSPAQSPLPGLATAEAAG